MNTPHHDLIGIGIGPFNLGLAALLEPITEVSTLFLEKKASFRWHDGIILPGTKLQVPFLADLVTMADPTSRFSYLNYLHLQDRIYKFYYYDRFLIPREEYDHYCRWVSEQLPSCHFGMEVRDVRPSCDHDGFVVNGVDSHNREFIFGARNVAVGVGTVPNIPSWACIDTRHPVFHTSAFRDHRDKLSRARRVTVIGSGQSAAECVLALYQDLSPDAIRAGSSIHWITRSPGFYPMEHSKIGQECFTPAYMEHFHRLDRSQRRKVVKQQGLLYKGISIDTISDIFDMMYERSIGGKAAGLTLMSDCIPGLLEDCGHDGLRLTLHHRNLDAPSFVTTDSIVLGTGYQHVWPDWMGELKKSVLACDENGDFIVDQDFTARRIDGKKGKIFVQNAEVFQHGVGSPDLGLGPYRNGIIINQLTGGEHYRTIRDTSFQTFGLPAPSYS